MMKSTEKGKKNREMSCPLHSVVSAPVSTESADCKRHTDLSLLHPPKEPDLLLSVFVHANNANDTSSLSKIVES